MLIAIRSVEAPRGSAARKVTGRKSAAERLFRRRRLIVTQRPAAVRRWSWTKRPAKERAPATRVDSRPAEVRRSEIDGPDAHGRRRAHAAVPARQVGRADPRLRQIAPRSVGRGQDRRDRSERAAAERLGEHRHDLSGPLDRNRPGQQDAAAVDDAERGRGERHADGRERDVGAAARACVARRDEPVVVGRPRREARERCGQAPRRRARAGASPRRLRSVARGRPVLEPPRRRASSRVGRAGQRRRRRADVPRSACLDERRERRAEAPVAADGRPGGVRRDQAVVVGGRPSAGRSATTRR